MARKPSTILTPQQEAFVEAKLDGKSDRQAAKAANYNSGAITKLSHNEAVKEKVAKGKEELANTTMIRRVDIIDGILDGIQMAKLQSEPATVIKGWVEIAKMTGHDKPEVRRVELSQGAQLLQHQLMRMSTAELLEMAAGNMHIDGEAERVDH